MGVVYKCIHEETGQIGAIKFIDTNSHAHSKVDNDIEMLSHRFSDEAKALSSFNSPYIVNILAVGEDGDLGKYLVMEFLPGPSLDVELQRGPLPFDKFKNDLAIPLLRGLSVLHNGGVLHRDIKPANLIGDSRGCYKISDFGLAVFGDRKAKTRTGYIIGTPGYLSPEQFMGDISAEVSLLSLVAVRGLQIEPQLFLSDIYSAGVVLTEALCGCHPFRSSNIGETVGKQMDFVPSADSIFSLARRGGGAISSRLASVLACSIQPKPADRFQSCNDFLKAIEAAWLDDSAIKPALDSPAPAGRGAENVTIQLDPRHRGIGKSLSPRQRHLQKRESKDPHDQKIVRSISLKAGLSLFFTALVIVALGWLHYSGNSVKIVSPDTGASLLTKHLQFLKDDFLLASQCLAKDGDNPLSANLKSFYDRGTEFYSELIRDGSIPLREKTRQWQSATVNLKGPEVLLGQCISLATNRSENFNTAQETLAAYREAFSASFNYKAGDSSARFTDYLKADDWLMERVFLSCAASYSGRDFFDAAHKVIIDSERFIGGILPSVPKGSGDGDLKNFSVPPLWDEAVSYRLRLFLLRALVFAGRVPVAPFLVAPLEDHTRFTDKEFVSSVDSGFSIALSVKQLLSEEAVKGSGKALNDFQRDELTRLTALILKMIQDDERSLAAINSSNQVLAAIEDAPIDLNRAFDVDSMRSMLSQTHRFLRNAEDKNHDFSGIVSSLRPKKTHSGEKPQRMHCALVLGRRALWFCYPQVVLENTILSRNTDFSNFPCQFLTYIRAFILFVDRTQLLAPFVDSQWFGEGINDVSLSELAANVALYSLKVTRPELLISDKDGTYPLATLQWYEYYVKSINEVFNGFISLSTLTAANEGSANYEFSNSLKLFCSRWDNSISRYLDKNSLLYQMLESRRLSIPDGKVDAKAITNSLKLSKVAFETIKSLILENGGSSAPFDPYIRFLVVIIEQRWDILRRQGSLDDLILEAMWVQNTFEKTIEADVKKAAEDIRREMLFSSAASNIGHVYLVRGQKELYKEQVPYLKLARSIISDPSSQMCFSIESVLNERPLF
jgi:serine/threonine protein kinase